MAETAEEVQARIERRIFQFDTARERPSTDRYGKQLAKQSFRRWLVAGIWEDTEGNPHIDVPKLLGLFELPDSPDARREVSQYALAAIAGAAKAQGESELKVVVQ